MLEFPIGLGGEGEEGVWPSCQLFSVLEAQVNRGAELR